MKIIRSLLGLTKYDRQIEADKAAMSEDWKRIDEAKKTIARYAPLPRDTVPPSDGSVDPSPRPW